MEIAYLQELELFYLIPAIRKELALVMKSNGKDQKEIAVLLGVTEAAVSKYVNKKRASEVKFDESVLKEIESVHEKIEGKQDTIRVIQTILREMKEDKTICDIHRKFSRDIPEDCDICFRK